MNYKIFIISLVIISIYSSCRATHQEKLNKKLLKAVRQNNHTQVLHLLQAGADINTHDTRTFAARECSGYTPLHYTVHYNYKELAQLLLNQGAQVNNTDDADYTPLHYAARDHKSSFVELLLSYNALVDVHSHGNTPLHITFDDDSSPFIKMLLIDLVKRTSSAHYTTVELLLSYGANVNAQSSNNGQTPLHYAAITGEPLLLELLLIYGANATLQDSFDADALYYTTDVSNIQLLLNFGATDEHWEYPENSASALLNLHFGINSFAEARKYYTTQTVSYQDLLMQASKPTREAFRQAIEEGHYALVKLFVRNDIAVELNDFLLAKAQYTLDKKHNYKDNYKAIGRFLFAYLQLLGIYHTLNTTARHTGSLHNLLSHISSRVSRISLSSKSHAHVGPIAKQGIIGTNNFNKDIVRNIARYL